MSVDFCDARQGGGAYGKTPATRPFYGSWPFAGLLLTCQILYAGRIVAGITGATGAVAGAYIADITDGEDRARHFGLMSACFGVGMVAGPVAGGLLGAISLHAPFLAAAVLNGLNLLLGCFLMQESHKGERRMVHSQYNLL